MDVGTRGCSSDQVWRRSEPSTSESFASETLVSIVDVGVGRSILTWGFNPRHLPSVLTTQPLAEDLLFCIALTVHILLLMSLFPHRFISIPLHFRGVTEAASPAQTIFPRMVLRNSSGLSTVYHKVG